jgi:hypothetical protein
LLYSKLDNDRWDQTRIQATIDSTTREVKSLEERLAWASKPLEVSVDAEELRRRFRNFGKMSIEEQREAIRQTFSKVEIDYGEAGEPVITGVKLRPTPIP